MSSRFTVRYNAEKKCWTVYDHVRLVEVFWGPDKVDANRSCNILNATLPEFEENR